MQTGFFEDIWTVTDLTRRVRELLTGDEQLRGVWVQGEVSNLSRPRSGHVYFTLKDANSALNCVIWRNQVARISFDLQDGMQVEARGSIDVYEAGGRYQLYVDRLRPVGQGGLYEAFVRLKEKLAAEGLFAPERKRPVPLRPRRIGVVTSATGAALQDILNTVRRRYPLATVVLAPSLVQGDEAPASLVRALVRLITRGQVDVILLARGGGSLEDLWAFNDEQVVRTVAASPVPVISGVGHETDFTLVDFAADHRAPTPTAAAEMATPVTREMLQADLDAWTRRLKNAVYDGLEERRTALGWLANRMESHAPTGKIREAYLRLDSLSRRLDAVLAQRLSQERLQVNGLAHRLRGLDPRAVLQRGYAILTSVEDGQVVSRRAQASPGMRLQARVSDGIISLLVEKDE